MSIAGASSLKTSECKNCKTNQLANFSVFGSKFEFAFQVPKKLNRPSTLFSFALFCDRCIFAEVSNILDFVALKTQNIAMNLCVLFMFFPIWIFNELLLSLRQKNYRMHIAPISLVLMDPVT